MAKTRRARIDAENGHRRVTRLRLRIIVKETRGYPTGYLQASSDTIQHGLESREVGYGFSIILCGHWIHPAFEFGLYVPSVVCPGPIRRCPAQHNPKGHAGDYRQVGHFPGLGLL